MVDPLTLATLGTAALTQGITFVYTQIGDLLRWRREQKTKAATEPMKTSVHSSAAPLDRPLADGVIDSQALDRHADQLAGLRGLLQAYAEGDKSVRPGDRQLLDQIEAARLLLEQVYGQRITFAGESRPATGSVLGDGSSGDSSEIGRFAARVIASGERAVAIGGNVSGTTIVTGDRTEGLVDRPKG